MIYAYRVYMCIMCALSCISLYLLPAGVVLASLNNMPARPQRPTPQAIYTNLLLQQKILTKKLDEAVKKKEAWVDTIKKLLERKTKSQNALFKYQQIKADQHMFLLEAFEQHGFTYAENPIKKKCLKALDLIDRGRYGDAKDCIKKIYEHIVDLEQKGSPKKAIALWKQEHARIEQVWYTTLCQSFDQSIINAHDYKTLLTAIRQENFAVATKLIHQFAKKLSTQENVHSSQLYEWACELMHIHRNATIDAHQRQCVFIMDLISNKQLTHAKERIKELTTSIEHLQKKKLTQEEIAQCKQLHNQTEHAWYAAACTSIGDNGTCLKLCVTILDQIRHSNNVKHNKQKSELHKSIRNIEQLHTKIIALKEVFCNQHKEYVSAIHAEEKTKKDLAARIEEIDDSPDFHPQRGQKNGLIEALESVKEILYAQKQDKQKLEALTTLCGQIYNQILDVYDLQAAHIRNIPTLIPEPIPAQDDALLLVGAGSYVAPDPAIQNKIETEVMCFNFNNSLLAELNDVESPKYARLVTRPAELKKRLEEVEHDLACTLTQMNNKPAHNIPARSNTLSPEHETMLRAAQALLKTDKKPQNKSLKAPVLRSSPLRSDVRSESQGSTELHRADAGPGASERTALLPKIKPSRSIDLGPDPRTTARTLPPRQPSISQVYTFRHKQKKPPHVLMGLESDANDF